MDGISLEQEQNVMLGTLSLCAMSATECNYCYSHNCFSGDEFPTQITLYVRSLKGIRLK